MAQEGAREKNIIIKGPPEAIEAAKRLISEKIGGKKTPVFQISVQLNPGPAKNLRSGSRRP